MSPLSSEDRRALLDLARQAIAEAVRRGPALDLPELRGALAEPAGAFVTLHRHGRLRGCIGEIGALKPLGRAVANCAARSAVEDPRFDPVREEEVAELEIEISVLSRLEEIVPEQVEAGRHGLLVVCGNHRGLLLPQVATEHHWGRERFLEETCTKAGLERDAWRDPATQLLAFTAEVFSESDLRAQPRAQAS
jgi:AmmeMemoRadiSam system protein A